GLPNSNHVTNQHLHLDIIPTTSPIRASIFPSYTYTLLPLYLYTFIPIHLYKIRSPPYLSVYITIIGVISENGRLCGTKKIAGESGYKDHECCEILPWFNV